MTEDVFKRERAKKNRVIAQHTKRVRARKKAGTISADEVVLADIHLKALRRKVKHDAKPWPENRESFRASVRDRLKLFEVGPYNIKPQILDMIAITAAYEIGSQQRKAVEARHKKAALKK
jgi:hypothetical protein